MHVFFSGILVPVVVPIEKLGGGEALVACLATEKIERNLDFFCYTYTHYLIGKKSCCLLSSAFSTVLTAQQTNELHN